MSSDPRDNSRITDPGPHDILCGRGGGTNAHSGNVKFRKLVAAHKLRYLAASKSDKPHVAREVVREWRAMDPPGRFLAKLDKKDVPPDGDKRKAIWHDVGDKKAREKASQCLRERNGAANEAVAALVKTVTASGEACPEDYATLMNKAALVKAQNDLTIQQQNEVIKMNNMRAQVGNVTGNGTGGMGGMGGTEPRGGEGSNNFCREAFEPISLQHQRYSPGSGGGFENGGGAQDDLIEAEIQRLLRQRQQQLMMSNSGQGGGGNADGGNLNGNNNNRGTGGGGRGMPQANNDGEFGGPQPYMGEESVMREYEQLMRKQRELNMMADKLQGMGGGMGGVGGMGRGMGGGMGGGGGGMGEGGMNGGGMGGGGMNGGCMAGLINTFNSGGMNSHMMSQASSDMLNPNLNGMMGMNGGVGVGGGGINNNNYGGGNRMSGAMQPNHNPDAAKDYMNRLRSLRQGGASGGGVATDRARSSPSGYGGGGAYAGDAPNNTAGNGVAMSGEAMMMLRNMQQQQQGQRTRVKEEFTIEEYQASLQQFLSHNDDFGGGGDDAEGDDARRMVLNAHHSQQYGSGNDNNVMAGGHCVSVPTNREDGNNNNNNNNNNKIRHLSKPVMIPIMPTTNISTHSILNSSNNKQCHSNTHTVQIILNKFSKIASSGSTSNSMPHGPRRLPMDTIIRRPLFLRPQGHRFSKTSSRLNNVHISSLLLGRCTPPNSILT
mmetsp:Transcript_37383/g.79740  ORF Transcript_37383/g.79740 Transcript_37383/m.79740 type:complete len:717 (+) Transcript_37383:647-2797(+)